ncbi:unnamed protein product [Rhodiola kirilowii]
MVENPEMEDLTGWSSFGGAKVVYRTAPGGNRFVVASGRNNSHGSVSQKFKLNKDLLYTFSAWIQLSEGSAPVTAIFKTSSGYWPAGVVFSEAGCWSMLKGGLTVDATGPAKLYFESNHASPDIWVDSVSLQPFTQAEWKSHQEASIEKHRTQKVRFQAFDATDKPLAGANLTFQQKALGFPFGCAINKNILNNVAYQNWFFSRFKYTTFENEMKWYTNEPSPGRLDYSAADAMLKLTRQHGVSVRGHNIFWDDPNYQPGWVKNLAPQQLRDAAASRINSVVRHFRGQVIHWDVVKENLHHNFFESKLGRDASTKFYQRAHALDPRLRLFLNEYNTLEQIGDTAVSAANYLGKIRDGVPLGIGLQGHFNIPNIPYMRSALDTLASANLPIWITELDTSGGNQAASLESIINEARSHPAVSGIVVWAAWSPTGCHKMCLTDNSFRNLPTGDVVDKIMQTMAHKGLVVVTDKNGKFETSLQHGDYELTVTQENSSSISTHSFNVTLDEDWEEFYTCSNNVCIMIKITW